MRSHLLVALLLGACTIPSPPAARLMCHNSNCAYTDVTRDDTLEALRESLALELDGRAMIDGTEIDLLWDPRASRCLFEHDHADADVAADASTALAMLGSFLRERRSHATWNGHEFSLKLELRPGAVPDERPLSRDEMGAFADCALAMAEHAESAASDAGLRLTVIFEAEVISQLLAFVDRPRWRPELAGRRRPRQFGVHSFSDVGAAVDHVGMVAMSWKQATDGDYLRYQELEADGVDLMMMSFDATQEALSAFEYVAPAYINTNEAPLLRRWVDSGWD